MQIDFEHDSQAKDKRKLHEEKKNMIETNLEQR